MVAALRKIGMIQGSGHRMRVMIDDAFSGSVRHATDLDHNYHAVKILNYFLLDFKYSFSCLRILMYAS